MIRPPSTFHRLATLLGLSVLAAAPLSSATSVAALPYSQMPLTDQHGREWNIDQSGNIQRGSGTDTLISNAAVLMMGTQQFYSQQPTISADGLTLQMPGPKPYAGISVTRHLRLLEKEGGIAYADRFTNVTGREITTVVEHRYHFSGQIKKLVTNTGRASPTELEAGEEGIVVEPAQNDGSLPAVVLSLTGARSPEKLKIALRNNFQLSVFHPLTLPPGGTATVIHAVGQIDLSGDGSTSALTRPFLDWELKRIARQLPKDWTADASNLHSESPLRTLKEWFPNEHWGIERGTSDILALGDDSLLKGRIVGSDLSITHMFGTIGLDWTQVVAIAGPHHSRSDEAHVWLSDGQILHGQLTATEARFELLSGTSVPIDFARLDRLVRGTTHGPEPGPPAGMIDGLIELWSGQRIAFNPQIQWQGRSRWGSLTVPWSSVITWTLDGGPGLPPLLSLREGTRLRSLAPAAPVEFQTRLFGTQSIPLSDACQAIHPAAILELGDADIEPAGSHLELAGEQRLVARVTSTSLTISTAAGPLSVAPAEIRELRDATADRSEPPHSDVHWYQVELWGGSTLVGQLQDPLVRVEGNGFSWEIPSREIRRLVNPLPRIQTSVMRRVSDLIPKLGDPDWKTREAASVELSELGPLALPALHEAARQATDPEVLRRIEALLTHSAGTE